MQHRKRGLRPLARRACGRRCKQRGTQLGSVGKQLGPRINGGSGERRLEKLSNDSEDERALKLATASSKNIDAIGRCKLPRRTQQPRLSNPRRPLDNDEPTLAAARRVEHRVERRKLRLTLEHDSRNNDPRQFVRHHHLLGHPSRGIRERKVRPRRLSRPMLLWPRLLRRLKRNKLRHLTRQRRGASRQLFDPVGLRYCGEMTKP